MHRELHIKVNGTECKSDIDMPFHVCEEYVIYKSCGNNVFNIYLQAEI